jgi:hypothetical protein
MARKSGSVSANWHDDPVAEAIMKELGLEYEVQVISLSAVDWKETQYNVGREKGGIDEDTRDDYALAMLDGDSFPRPVALPIKNNKYTIPAGAHRGHATKEAGHKEFLPYVITSPYTEDQIKLLSLMTNRKEGRRIDKHLAMAQAVRLVQGGADPGQTAKKLGVNVGTLRHNVRNSSTERKAADAGFTGRLAPTSWKHLSPLASNGNVLKAAAKAVETANLSREDITSLVKAAKAKATEAQQIAEIETHPIVKAASVKVDVGPLKLKLRKDLGSAMRALSAILSKGSRLEDFQIARDSDDHKEFKDLGQTIVKGLNNALK